MNFGVIGPRVGMPGRHRVPDLISTGSNLLHHKRAALRAARFSVAPKTLESTSIFRPCDSAA
jgi:hypothetical protein